MPKLLEDHAKSHGEERLIIPSAEDPAMLSAAGSCGAVGSREENKGKLDGCSWQ